MRRKRDNNRKSIKVAEKMTRNLYKEKTRKNVRNVKQDVKLQEKGRDKRDKVKAIR